MILKDGKSLIVGLQVEESILVSKETLYKIKGAATTWR
jgi:hypothetical protein